MGRHAALYGPRRDGTRLADHCEAVVAQGGDWPEEFPLPEVPEGAEELWECFWSLRRAAGAGMNGPEAVRPSEMTAWATLHGVRLLPSQVSLLELMDATYAHKAALA